jgi:hypothetical protein
LKELEEGELIVELWERSSRNVELVEMGTPILS